DGKDWYWSDAAISEDRVFFKQYQTRKVIEEYDHETYEYWTRGDSRVQVLDGSLQPLADFSEASGNNWSELRARGTRAFTSENGSLRVFDTSDVDEPRMYD